MLNSGRYLELYLAVGWAGAVIIPLYIRLCEAGSLKGLTRAI